MDKTLLFIAAVLAYAGLTVGHWAPSFVAFVQSFTN